MGMKVFAALRFGVSQFRDDRRGNVAVIFAVALVPLVAAIGVVVDYARLTMANSEMQDALDATALYISRDGNVRTMTQARMQSIANGVFAANFTDANAKNEAITPVYTASGPTVKVTGTAIVPMTFMSIFGQNDAPISATSTVTWGRERLRVALVLDNTGSMDDDGKMEALQAATHNLLDELQNAATLPEDVYVSIVPFAKDVNLGSGNYNASWIDWNDWDEIHGSCSKKKYTDKTSCENKGKKWTAEKHKTWNGCATDRTQDYDTTNTLPTTSNSHTLYPAEQYGDCPAQTIGLTNDWDALGEIVDDMHPNGNTNQGIGVQVGWQTLTGTPFVVPSEDPDYQYKYVIILLTDGLNTEDRWYTRAWQIDDRQELACNGAKDAGIEVFAVQVNTRHDPTQDVLENCASDTDHFFELTTADQIVTTFDAIGTALSDLRISS